MSQIVFYTKQGAVNEALGGIIVACFSGGLLLVEVEREGGKK